MATPKKPRSIETSEELQDAIDGDRKNALQFYRKTANGVFDLETKLFLQTVAARILIADCVKGRRRADALLRALSLSGTADKNREMRETAEVFNSIMQMDAGAKHPFVGAALVRFTESKFPDVADVRKTLQNELAKMRRGKKAK